MSTESNNPAITPAPEDSDDFSGLFDEKPSRRVAWIIPSILLHVVVIVAWFYMPEEEIVRPGNRELVIRSDQAAQLKDFVEDTNLETLRMEVRRLQEIKAAVLDIRTQHMNELAEFEKEMVGQVGDVAQKLVSIADSQKNILTSQKLSASILTELKTLSLSFKNHANAKDYPAVLDSTRKISENFDKLNTQNQAMINDLRALLSKFDVADSALSWLRDEHLSAAWKQLHELQEKVFMLQSSATDLAGRTRINLSGHLKHISENAPSFNDRIRDFDQAFAKASEEHENLKKEVSQKIVSLTSERDKLQQQVKDSESSINNAKKQQADTKGRIPKSTKTEEEKKLKVELDASLKRIAEELSSLEKRKRELSDNLKKSNDSINAETRRLNSLKAPQPNRDRERLTQDMQRNIEAVSAFNPDSIILAQNEATASQEAAVNGSITLAEKIRNFTRRNE